MLKLVLLLSAILLTLTLIKEIKIRKNFKELDNFPISNSNKIRFVKLQKEYLDKIPLSEILELNSFIKNYYLMRFENENKE